MRRRALPERITFLRGEPTPLVELVARALARPGSWLNVAPDPEEVDPRAMAGSGLFGARGRAAPMGTLVVATEGRRHQLGIEHGAGKRVVVRLRDSGVVFPTGSTVRADHPRRGLVLEVPVTASASELAHLLVRAGSELTIVPLPEQWVADFYPG